MKYFVNYAHKNYYNSQLIALESAKKFGFKTIKCGFEDLDFDFVERNKHILNQNRGVGYWLWKPYIILKTLMSINENDYLVYMDSGANLTKDVDDLLDIIDYKGILSFKLKNCPNYNWIKGDCFFAINSIDDIYKFKDEEQILASFIFLKKTMFSVNFIKKWLYYAQQENVITDVPNLCVENCKEFIDHRHDQSIFSLLCYNYNVINIPDISQFGKLHELSDNHIRVHHHRNKD